MEAVIIRCQSLIHPGNALDLLQNELHQSHMKLSTLLFGDLADYFQDKEIENVKNAASGAQFTSNYNRTEIGRLAQVVEKRLREVESENAMLALVLVRVLKQLSQTAPEETQAIIDEVAGLLSSKTPPTDMNFLRQLLDLPPLSKTPIVSFHDPRTKPLAPIRPNPAPGVTKPQGIPPAAKKP